MGDFNWSLALYDIIAVVVPGYVLPALIGVVFPKAWQFYSWSALTIIAVAFITGHVVQAAAKGVYSLVDRLWCWEDFLSSVSEEFKTHLKMALKQYYGADFSAKIIDKHMKDLCYSPVWNRMDNYKVFIALADFNRAIGVLALLAGVEFAGMGAKVWTGVIYPVTARWSAGGAPRTIRTPGGCSCSRTARLPSARSRSGSWENPRYRRTTPASGGSGRTRCAG